MSASLREPLELFDRLPVGICILTRDWIIRYWNATLADWTGLLAETVLGNPVRSVCPQLAAAPYAAHITPVFSGSPPAILSPPTHSQIFPVLRRDDGLCTQQVVALAIQLDDRPPHVMLVVYDVTAPHTPTPRNDAHRDALEPTDTNHQLGRLFEAAKSGVCLLNQHHCILFANHRAGAMLGQASHTLLGQSLDTLIPALGGHRFGTSAIAHQDSTSSTDHSSHAAGNADRIVIEGIGNSQTPCPLELTWCSLPTTQEPCTLIVINHSAIEANTVARSAPTIDTSQATAHALSTAPAEPPTPSTSPEKVLHAMSHELRTPINGIIGMTDLLLHTSLTKEQREFANAAKRSGEWLLSIVNDLLDDTSTSSRTFDLDHFDFDLRSLVHTVVDHMTTRASDKGIDLVAVFHASTPNALRGDAGRIRYVLMHLVANALNDTERGEIVIRVSATDEHEHAVTMRFSVSHAGTGLPDSTRDPGSDGCSWQTPLSAKERTTDFAGLTECEHIVKHMRGEIGIHHTFGHGSEVWFTLPLERQSLASIGPTDHVALHTVHACVVMPEATTSMLIASFAKQLGMFCTQAATGDDALCILRASRHSGAAVNLVIVDHTVSDMTGVQLAKRIRADHTLRGIRLMMVSSAPERGEARQARDAGFLAYLTPPLQQDVFRDCVTRVMATDIAADTERSHDFRTLITRHSLEEDRNRHRPRILLVEDNHVSQQVCTKMFHKLGCQLDVVSSSEESMAALQRDTYDLCVIEAHMPEPDALETIVTMLQLEMSSRPREADTPSSASEQTQASSVPMMVLTPDADSNTLDAFYRNGVSEYLVRPFTIEQLQHALERQLPSKRTANVRPNLEVDAQEHTPPPFDLDGLRLDRHTTSPPLDAILDLYMLRNLYDLGGEDDPDFLGTVIDQFERDLPEHLEEIRKAAQNRQPMRLLKASHNLKGSAQYVGAHQLVNTCRELEHLSREMTIDGIDEVLNRLDVEVEQTHHAFQMVLERALSTRSSY